MSSHLKELLSDNVGKKSITKQQPETAHVALPALRFKRALGARDSLSHTEIMQLQRTIGNRRVSRLLSNTPPIQPKLTVGSVGDKYEQEADQVAENVVTQSNAFSPQPAQRREPEEEELLQGQFETTQRQAAEDEDLIQGRFAGSEPPTQRQGVEDTVENRTGMPDPLKAGLEQLSGLDLSGVRVHRNSATPAQLNALAYAQGQDIHVGPGQEQHLPHEGWHAVQQAQGRVKPTMQAQGEGVSINDDEGLEHEADVMGAKALIVKFSGERTGPGSSRSVGSVGRISPSPTILQRCDNSYEEFLEWKEWKRTRLGQREDDSYEEFLEYQWKKEEQSDSEAEFTESQSDKAPITLQERVTSRLQEVFPAGNFGNYEAQIANLNQEDAKKLLEFFDVFLVNPQGAYIHYRRIPPRDRVIADDIIESHGQLFEEWTESEFALGPKKKAKSKFWPSYEDAFGPSPVATPVDATLGIAAVVAGSPIGSASTLEPSLGTENPAAGWEFTGLGLSAFTLAGTLATIVMGGRKYHQAGKDLIDPKLDEAARELAKREQSEGWLQVVKGVFALGKLLEEDLASILKLVKDSGSAVASSIAAGIGVVWNGIQAVLLSRRAFKAGKRRRKLRRLFGSLQADSESSGSENPVFKKAVKYAQERSQRREIRAAAAATGAVFGVAAGAVGFAIAAGAAALGLTPAGWALAAAAAAFGLAFLGYKIGKKIYKKYYHRKRKAKELVEELLEKDESTKRQDAEEYLLQLLGLIPTWVRAQARTGAEGKKAMISLVRERLDKKRDFVAEGVWAALTGPEQDEARDVVKAMGLDPDKVLAGEDGKELIKKKLPSWF